MMHCERFIRPKYWRSRIEPDSPNGSLRNLGPRADRPYSVLTLATRKPNARARHRSRSDGNPTSAAGPAGTRGGCVLRASLLGSFPFRLSDKASRCRRIGELQFV